jgi:hypothetical protein
MIEACIIGMPLWAIAIAIQELCKQLKKQGGDK